MSPQKEVVFEKSSGCHVSVSLRLRPDCVSASGPFYVISAIGGVSLLSVSVQQILDVVPSIFFKKSMSYLSPQLMNTHFDLRA